ncbi:MAG: hypothetical protein LBV30_07065 [Propionibacteriaceae bacterium]|jgi:hypothetical protein|nr:hypothetical protein [Propionibacteriaceae bacterium]
MIAQKEGSGELRTDAQPLITRFPLIGQPESVAWYSGTMSGDAPGPSTYWIDAVITVTPDVGDRLAALATQPVLTAPDVVEDLTTQLPRELMTGPDLGPALTKDGEHDFWVTAYYSPSSRQLVITALGE